MPFTFWIVLGAVVLAVCCGSGKRRGSRSSGGRKEAFRIDHPHYDEPDDYECSVCGARFRRESMVCPRCGARFLGIREDDTEMMEEEEWEEEEDL